MSENIFGDDDEDIFASVPMVKVQAHAHSAVVSIADIFADFDSPEPQGPWQRPSGRKGPIWP